MFGVERIKDFHNQYQINPETKCFDWKGYIDVHGYGKFSINNKQLLTHRLAWILINGDIPPGLCICHKCDNRKCVNPEHLFLGTKADNNRDMKEKGRASTGIQKGMAKLTEKQVLSIYKAKGTQRTIGKRFNISATQVNVIKNKKEWRWLLWSLG